MIKIFFFGTHDFAAFILRGLINSGLVSIKGVVTRPDRPAGKKQNILKSPVKNIAEKYKIKIYQPESLKNYELPNSGADLYIVAQYGLIIPKKIINTPKYGTLNIHTSLLPKYRGASPIQSALINGETKTGVTIIKMNEKLDAGPIILQKQLKIDPDDTYLELDKKLAQISLKTLLTAIPNYINGRLKPIPQDESKATNCGLLNRKDGHIQWNKSAAEIYNLYRGLTPWPGIWSILDGKRLKLLKIKLANKKLNTGEAMVKNHKIYIGCGKGSIEILQLQLEGKKPMGAEFFLNGYDINAKKLK